MCVFTLLSQILGHFCFLKYCFLCKLITGNVLFFLLAGSGLDTQSKVIYCVTSECVFAGFFFLSLLSMYHNNINYTDFHH